MCPCEGVRVELRRALLLFAIVLGVAAVVTSLSSPREPADTSAGLPAVSQTPLDRLAPRPTTIRFDAARAPVTRTLDAGRPATVTVAADEPGDIELEGLALLSPVERLTPARFDVYATRPGRHSVRMTSASAVRGRSVGVLVIRPRR